MFTHGIQLENDLPHRLPEVEPRVVSRSEHAGPRAALKREELPGDSLTHHMIDRWFPFAQPTVSVQRKGRIKAPSSGHDRFVACCRTLRTHRERHHSSRSHVPSSHPLPDVGHV